VRASLLLLVALAGCSRTSEPWLDAGTYSGYYTFGYEVSEFVPSGTKEKWWLGRAAPCIPRYTKDTVGSAPPSNPVRFVVVRGTLTAAGHHGHLGAYSREFTPQEFLECRELSPDEHADF
jgi:hypothetical protein